MVHKGKQKSIAGVLAILVGFGMACRNTPSATDNPPMPGFNLKDSDPRAVRIADEVMKACGGRENWDRTRYITWRALGKRLNVWDKWTGDVRVESRRSLILMNLHTMQGRAWKDRWEIKDSEELKRALQYGYEAWIHDSYWLFLPFKLKDSGVTLKYLGEGTTVDGREADILSLTFSDVGVTPENKYHVYVDKESKLVTQWSYFMDASDPHPRFTTPWGNYQRYGRILLSDDRGKKKHTGVAVFDELPRAVFESPQPIDWETLMTDLTANNRSDE